eukprot:609661-Amphidinium_carterae.1
MHIEERDFFGCENPRLGQTPEPPNFKKVSNKCKNSPKKKFGSVPSGGVHNSLATFSLHFTNWSSGGTACFLGPSRPATGSAEYLSCMSSLLASATSAGPSKG